MAEQTTFLGVLLNLAAEGMAPVIPGCAQALASGSGYGGRSEKAIRHFGRRIVTSWLTWLTRQPRVRQQAAFETLATLSLGEARSMAAAAVTNFVPKASAQDLTIAIDYLAALPQALRRGFVTDPVTGARAIPSSWPLDREEMLLGLLPIHVPMAALRLGEEGLAPTAALAKISDSAERTPPQQQKAPTHPDVPPDVERLKLFLVDQIERDALDAARNTVALLLKLAPSDPDVRDAKAFLEQQQQTAAPAAGAEGEIRCFAGHGNWVNSVAFSPDGRWLLSGSGGTMVNDEIHEGKDRSLRLWEVAAGQAVRLFHGNHGMVTSVAFVPDGPRALSASLSGNIYLWNLDKGNVLRLFDKRASVVWQLACSPDGRWVLAGGDDDKVRLWEVASGRCVRRFEGHPGGVQGVAFSPDGLRALCGGADQTLRVWEVGSGKLLRTLAGHAQELLSVAWAPNASLGLAAGAEGTISLWNLDDGRVVRRFAGHAGSVHSVAFSPDGRRALTGGSDRRLLLWDVDSGRELAHFKGHTDSVTCVAFAPDGRSAVSGSRDATIRLWQLP